MSNCREYLGLIVQSMKSYVDKVTSGFDAKIKSVSDNTPSDISYNSSSRHLQLTSTNGNKLGEGVTLPGSDWSGNVDLSEYAKLTDINNKEDKLFVHVKRNGAKGDGSTDDTNSIMKLIQNGYRNLYFDKGTYKCSLNLASISGLTIQGESMKETILTPATNNYCIRLDSTNGNMDNNHFSNFTLKNNSNFTSANAIEFIGNKENDRHIFKNIIIQNGFDTGLYMSGRCIWSIFENFWIDGCNIGIKMFDEGVKNLLTFNNVYVRSSKTNALLMNGTSSVTYMTIVFNNCNFENNCRDTSVPTQYAVKLAEFDELTFNNCYIENNSNGTSTTYAIYCDGTFNRCLNILGSLIWGQEYGICIEGTIMSGTISGNRIINTNEDIIIGTETNAGGGHEESAFSLLGNTLSHPLKKNQDINMNNSVTTLNPLSLAYRHANNNPTPDVRNCNVIMSWTSESITNFLNGTNGQIVIVYVYGNTSKVFSNGTNIQLRSDDSVTISKGETISFIFFNNKWIEIFRNKN